MMTVLFSHTLIDFKFIQLPFDFSWTRSKRFSISNKNIKYLREDVKEFRRVFSLT